MMIGWSTLGVGRMIGGGGRGGVEVGGGGMSIREVGVVGGN